ncbi:MAG TPA: AAA family ATPase [Ktedonobacterales bacterium]|nr:AAA family ATPase [Ktedonobacterales bacterium]
MARNGLVIGKFYPPHRGHKYLIDTAQGQVEHLVVLVCDDPRQSIPATLRAEWLREIHPGADVQVIPDTVADDDSPGWADYTRRWLGYSPDVVFTSEDYGVAYAHYLGCEHVSVDRERRHVPISGTAIRANPLAHWDYLEPCVRAYFAKRICVLGAESTGTTTMAQALAEHYQTVWVPEYGRDYWVERVLYASDHTWQTSEFVHIATRQCQMEDEAARQCNRLLMCDTDAFATSVWHERYLGQRSPEVEAVAATREYALTLLTDVDIPFVQDGTRDGEYIRHGMHRRFEERLAEAGRPYILLSGSHAARLEKATAAIDALLTAE